MKYLQGDCAKENRGVGSGEPGQPFLPCLFCVFKHHLRTVSITHTTWGQPIGEKSFQPCKTGQIQKENRGEEGFS